MLDIYRGAEVNLTIKIDDNTRLIRQLLGEDIIKSSFNSHSILDITIGDYITYDSVKYYINNLPNVKKNATNSFDYNIAFESEYYELLKTQFMDSDGNSDFDLVGNLETFINLIVTNMNRTHSGWAKGTCDQTNTDYKLQNFSKSNCMQVLQRLCREFEGEFYFDGKDICFTDKAGSDSGLTFKYKQGLRNIHRTTLSEKNIITRLYAFGSEKNLSSDYRDHSRRLKFVVDDKSYLEKNVDKYGTIEFTKIYNDIYPHREGTISSVDGEDITKFFDNGMNFDLNDYLLPGVTAKLHFNSGDLGGYEFEVSAYNNDTKEFTIIIFTDEQGYEMPNATLKPAIGDKYVLLDIKMPQSYIDTAETALQTKAQAYLDDNCEPRVTYILTPDPRYFKIHFIDLVVGDFITIEDTDLGIDVMTRIVELTKSVANEYRYTLKLTDHLEVQLIRRLYDEQEGLKQKIEIDYGGDIIRSRRNWKTSEELRTMIFDTDGYFDMGNIRPASVETEMLSVGAKSTQFVLKGIEIEANYTGDKSKFHASAGSLIHLSIADAIRTWTLSENSQDSLTDGTAYYIYAKCTKEPGYTGQILVDETARKFDDDPTYYYFLIGVLHSVIEGVRGISLTYGQTIINGKFIRTGKIESTDGLTYFDLDNSEIRGKITFTANTSGYANITDKPEVYQIFSTTPIPPYEVGDLWTDGNDIYRCKIARSDAYSNFLTSTGKQLVDSDSKNFLSRAYLISTDWELATNYTDDTVADGKAKIFRQPTAPTSGMQVGDMWIDTDDGNKPYTYNGSIWIQAYTIIDGGNIEAGSLTLVSAATDFNWSSLEDDGNKPDDDADVTGNNTAKDIINLPDTPAGAGLYATGSYLGYYDGGAWKAYIQGDGKFYFKGDANNYIQWNGASLAIKGSITLVNTIPNAKVDGLGDLALEDSLAYGDITGTKPPSNADVTLSAIQGELSLAGGGLVLASAGAKIRGGQTAYGVGTGFWLGDVSGVTKLSIGSSTKYMKWDGVALTIKGLVSLDSLSVLNSNLGTITAGNITLNTSGFIRTTGKDNYADTTAGFFLGYDGGYKLNIGNASNWLKWTGSELQIKGRLSVGGGTNEDIYFEDSTIRLYDFGAGGGAGTKGVALRYSSDDFLKIYYYPAGHTASLVLESDESTYRHMDFVDRATYGMIGKTYAGHTVSVSFWPEGGDHIFSFHGRGQFQLPNLSSNPTVGLSTGQLCIVNNVLKIYNGADWVNV